MALILFRISESFNILESELRIARAINPTYEYGGFS